MSDTSEKDLGFTYKIKKNGELEIRHRAKFATKFGGSKCGVVHTKLENLSFEKQQELMAKLTGNYKRGNERLAKNHPRNMY